MQTHEDHFCRRSDCNFFKAVFSDGNEKTADSNLLGIQLISKLGFNVKAHHEDSTSTKYPGFKNCFSIVVSEATGHAGPGRTCAYRQACSRLTTVKVSGWPSFDCQFEVRTLPPRVMAAAPSWCGLGRGRSSGNPRTSANQGTIISYYLFLNILYTLFHIIFYYSLLF